MKKAGVFLLIFLVLPFVLGAGSGSGGSLGSSGGSRTESIDFANKNSFDQTFTQGNVYAITLGDQSKYFVYAKKIEGNTLTLILRTTPEKELIISVGNHKEIDFNMDGISDVLFSVNSIPSNNRAAITITDTFEKSNEVMDESSLLCGDRNTREERIRCRLHLQKDALEEEYVLQYLPEECRDLADRNREVCIQRYKDSQRCWEFKEDVARVNCVKDVLKFKGINEERRICNSLKDLEKRDCVSTLKENVFNIIKFRFYNLEERAEDLMKEGKIPEGDTVAFIAAVEGKKTEFNNADSIKKKKEIVKEVETLWISFQKLQ